MLKGITWVDYFTLVAVATVVYYVFYILVFYRKETLVLISGRRKRGASGAVNPADEQDPSGPDEYGPGNSFAFSKVSEQTYAEVERVVDDVKGVIADASSDNHGKEQVKDALHAVLATAGQLKGTPFQTSITELIVAQIEEYGITELSEGEVDELWDR